MKRMGVGAMVEGITGVGKQKTRSRGFMLFPEYFLRKLVAGVGFEPTTFGL